MFEMFKPVIKNLFSTPVTRLYPFEIREQFADVRGDLKIDISKCIYCKICEKKCPSDCITVDKDACKFQLDPYSCVLCSVCVDACPKDALYMNTKWRPPVAIKEDEISIGVPVVKKAPAAKQDQVV